MTEPNLLAQIIWPFMVIISLWVLINYSFFKQLVWEVVKSNALLFMISLIRLTLWLIIITIHNEWSSLLNVIISVFGRLIAISGTIWFLFPNQIKLLAKPYIKKHRRINNRAAWQTIATQANTRQFQKKKKKILAATGSWFLMW